MMLRITTALLLLLPVISLATEASAGLSSLPANNEYCLQAQRVIVRTDIDMDLVVHNDFDAFVKSKAIIEGPNGRPQIQQFNWVDSSGALLGISCKLKNTDHLNLTFDFLSNAHNSKIRFLSRVIMSSTKSNCIMPYVLLRNSISAYILFAVRPRNFLPKIPIFK